MNRFCSEMQGKKVTVMGLGLLGRGVGDTAYLAECGAEVTVTDLKSEEELATSLKQLAGYTNISYTLGEHKEADFKGRDMILKAAGVPLRTPYIDIAESENTSVEMSAALFHAYSDLPMIGVTGTRGKSSVTNLVQQVLAHAGKQKLLGGNVRGISNLQLLKEVDDKEVAIFELDSWQLQGFGTRRISPQIAVFTTFMDDHANYYDGDMEQYFADKAHIFHWQNDDDVLVVGEGVVDAVFNYMQLHDITKDVVIARVGDIPADWHPQLVGAHNQLNAACAYHALTAYGLSDDEIREGMQSVPPVAGRFEYVGEIEGVRIINDATSTTPDATIAGVRAVERGKGKLHVIVGGADKDLSLDGLAEVLVREVDTCTFLRGAGTEKLRPFFKEYVAQENLADAVDAALADAVPGDTLLFSPGFASFGMFQNEYDRNDQFMEILSAKGLTKSS